MAVQSGTPVVTEAPAVAPVVAPVVVQQDPLPAQVATTAGPVGGGQLVRRIVVLVFGLIQLVIALRFVLVLLDARTANALVSAVMNVSQVFVAPFNGILNADALVSSGSTVDVAAIVAFIGWTLLEVVILWAVGIFRREPA
jgi:hypothetical protein